MIVGKSGLRSQGASVVAVGKCHVTSVPGCGGKRATGGICPGEGRCGVCNSFTREGIEFISSSVKVHHRRLPTCSTLWLCYIRRSIDDKCRTLGNANPQPATRNPQPATRNPQPATRKPLPTTRNAHKGRSVYVVSLPAMEKR